MPPSTRGGCCDNGEYGMVVTASSFVVLILVISSTLIHAHKRLLFIIVVVVLCTFTTDVYATEWLYVEYSCSSSSSVSSPPPPPSTSTLAKMTRTTTTINEKPSNNSTLNAYVHIDARLNRWLGLSKRAVSPLSFYFMATTRRVVSVCLNLSVGQCLSLTMTYRRMDEKILLAVKILSFFVFVLVVGMLSALSASVTSSLSPSLRRILMESVFALAAAVTKA